MDKGQGGGEESGSERSAGRITSSRGNPNETRGEQFVPAMEKDPRHKLQGHQPEAVARAACVVSQIREESVGGSRLADVPVRGRDLLAAAEREAGAERLWQWEEPLQQQCRQPLHRGRCQECSSGAEFEESQQER